jgi:4-hydroxybenzoate polyprenyltransferase
VLRAGVGAGMVGLGWSLLSIGSWRVVAIFAGHLLAGVFYAKIKRRLSCFKAIFVTLCVVFMAAALPVACSAWTPVAEMGSVTAAGFARSLLLISCVSFTVEQLQDVRDISEDKKVGVETLASRCGAKEAIRWLRRYQLLCLVLHCCTPYFTGLQLRADQIVVYGACIVFGLSFHERTPPYLFQLALEPLYAVPLVASLTRGAIF